MYGRTRAEVREKADSLRQAQRAGVDLSVRPRTVEEWLTEWLRDIKGHDGTRPSTIIRYRDVVQTHLIPGLGRIRLDKLTPRDVHVFLLACRPRLSPGSVVKVHGVLRVALGDAERLDLVVRNVAKLVKPPSIDTVERRTLTPDEARHFLEVVGGDRLEAVFVIALTLGLRRGEVLGLKWTDVNLVTRELRVERALQRIGDQLRLVEPKTRRSRRPLPIPMLAVHALERHRARQVVERAKAGPDWQESGLVFTSTIGTPMEPRNVNTRFQRLRTEADLPWLRLHDLRHGCATFLLANGVEPGR